MTESKAGLGPRLLATAIDVALGVAVALLLSTTTGTWFARRAAATLSIGSDGSLWRGPLPMLFGIFGTFLYGFPFAALLVSLPEGLAGAGFGKRLARVEVRLTSGSQASLASLFARWLIKWSGFLLVVAGLSFGNASFLGAGLVVAVLVLICFLASAARRPSLHDRLAGTVAVRRPAST